MSETKEVKSKKPARVIVVTGASSGLGEAIAKLQAIGGAHVVVAGPKEMEIERVVGACTRLRVLFKQVSPMPYGIVCDMINPDNIEEVINEVILRFKRIDGLILNSGTILDLSLYSPRLQRNYKKLVYLQWESAIRLSYAAAPHIDKVKGTITIVSSIARPSPYLLKSKDARRTIEGFKKLFYIRFPNIKFRTVFPGPNVCDVLQSLGFPHFKFVELGNDVYQVNQNKESQNDTLLETGLENTEPRLDSLFEMRLDNKVKPHQLSKRSNFPLLPQEILDAYNYDLSELSRKREREEAVKRYNEQEEKIKAELRLVQSERKQTMKQFTKTSNSILNFKFF